MNPQRKILFAVMAWVLPLVMLASWSAQAAGMLCRAQGAVVRSGCCCGAGVAMAAEPAPTSELADAGCCEVTASQAPVVVPMALPVFDDVPQALPVLLVQLLMPPPAVVPPGGWARADVPRALGHPLPLLKHSFLI